MRQTIIEKVFVNAYFWMIVFLVLATTFSVVALIHRRLTGAEDRDPQPAVRKPAVRRKKRQKKDLFSEKLGEKVVGYMIEVSRSKDKTLLRDRLTKIRRECERLSREPLPEEARRIIMNVLYWSTHFDVDKHVSEMEIYRNSTQINYNDRTRDFKLMITEE